VIGCPNHRNVMKNTDADGLPFYPYTVRGERILAALTVGQGDHHEACSEIASNTSNPG